MTLPVTVTDPILRSELIFAKDNLVCHMRYIELLEPYPTQEELCERLQNGSRELISIFREFGKSTMGEILACNELAFKEDAYVFYFSYTDDAVLPRIGAIRDFFERDLLPSGKPNPFQQMVPERGSKGYTWGGKKFTLKNHNTFQGAGADTFVLGAKERKLRPSLIIIDDPVHPDQANTDKKIILEWFKKTISNLGGPMTRIIVIGTTRRHSDLIMFLLGEKSVYNKNYYPAIKEENGEKIVTVPEYWLREGSCCFDIKNPAFACMGLSGDMRIQQHIKQKMNEIGSIAWSTEFLLKPQDDGSSLFPMKILEDCKNKDMTFEDYRKMFRNINWLEYDYGVRKDRPVTVIGCDHAISESEEADWSVLTVLMCNPGERIKMIDQRRGHWSLKDVKKELRELNAIYRPGLVYSEADATQRVWAQDFNEYIKEVPVRPFETRGKKNNYEVKLSADNKTEMGIPSMKSYWENRAVEVPYGVGDHFDETMEVVDELLRQLNGTIFIDGKVETTTDHDDDMMSFWIALHAALDLTIHTIGVGGFSMNNEETKKKTTIATDQGDLLIDDDGSHVWMLANYGKNASYRDQFR